MQMGLCSLLQNEEDRLQLNAFAGLIQLKGEPGEGTVPESNKTLSVALA